MGVTKLELFLKHYEVQKEVGGKILSPLVNSNACKREFLNISSKLQGLPDWNDKTFRILWTIVTWNSTLQVKYATILV